MGLGPTLSQVPWHEKLRRTLARRRGARLGEATVVSRHVHVSVSQNPEVLSVVTSSDAGQAFYGRGVPGEIIHLDIFHAVADVDHRRIAAALRSALPHPDSAEGKLLLDYFDLMTG
ncbi:MAG: magnesium chelatase, partial [Firmicutes bacterium]|nr:magnesium chelatase [Bacillota bacterium]